jgi:hypothetical protein
MTGLLAAIDPALEGRELGPWTMISAWITLPVAIAVAGALVWYFVRLGRPDVPRGRRWLRRSSIVCALAALGLIHAYAIEHAVGSLGGSGPIRSTRTRLDDRVRAEQTA